MISTNAQATRPKHIGNLSLMKRNFNGQSIEEWKKYLTDVDPYIIDKVVSKIMDKSIEMCITAPYLNYDTIKIWAEDLIFNKTFIGFYIENLVFDTVSKKFGLKFHRQLTSNDESQGIDGYLNDKPFNVKPCPGFKAGNVTLCASLLPKVDAAAPAIPVTPKGLEGGVVSRPKPKSEPCTEVESYQTDKFLPSGVVSVKPPVPLSPANTPCTEVPALILSITY
jgi:hypothetical protein